MAYPEMLIKELLFATFLLGASWQDLRKKQIPLWLFILFGLLGVGAIGLFPEQRGAERAFLRFLLAFLPGLFLLAASMCTRGAIGEGDGVFFLVAGLYLPPERVTALLGLGLLFSSACGLGISVWGFVGGISVRHKRMPFLPFLVPAWLWMTVF